MDGCLNALMGADFMPISCKVEFMPPFNEMSGINSFEFKIEVSTLEAVCRYVATIFPGLKPVLAQETDLYPMVIIKGKGVYRLWDEVELTEGSNLVFFIPLSGG